MLSVRSQSCCPQAPDSPKLPKDWHQACLSSIDETVPLIEVVANAMVVQGYPRKDIFGMWLALEERLVNLFKDGHKNQPTNQVLVRYKVDPENVLVEVEDQGAEFDPWQEADPTTPQRLDQPSGRGLLLIRSYATWLRYNEQTGYQDRHLGEQIESISVYY